MYSPIAFDDVAAMSRKQFDYCVEYGKGRRELREHTTWRPLVVRIEWHLHDREDDRTHRVYRACSTHGKRAGRAGAVFLREVRIQDPTNLTESLEFHGMVPDAETVFLPRPETKPDRPGCTHGRRWWRNHDTTLGPFDTEEATRDELACKIGSLPLGSRVLAQDVFRNPDGTLRVELRHAEPCAKGRTRTNMP